MQQPVNWPGWEFVRKLGSGSYGSVYEIRQQVGPLERRAALKVIPVPRDENELEDLYALGYDKTAVEKSLQSQAEDVIREFSVMMELKGYTNIVYGEDLRCVPRPNGSGMDVCIQMELLTPLVRALQPEQAQSQAVTLGRDLLQALAICRSQKIVHRDIKPQNIFVSRSGDYKLGDFGVARAMDRTGSATKIGTINYMAPEVYHGEHYGSASDVYSLGMVLYWLLNDRRLPFVSMLDRPPKQSEIEQAAAKRLQGEPLPLPTHGSEALKKLVCSMCAYHPAERPGVDALQDAFRSLGGGQHESPAPAPKEPAVSEPAAPVILDVPEEMTIGILSGGDAKPEAEPSKPEPVPEPPKQETPAEPEPTEPEQDVTLGVHPLPASDPLPQPAKEKKVRLPAIGKRARIALSAAAAMLVLAACILLFIPNGSCLLLGHHWEGGGDRQLETCSRCGRLKGNLNVTAALADGTVTLNNIKCGYFELSRPVNDCTCLAFRFGISEYSGTLPTEWVIMGRHNRIWSNLGSFEIDLSAVVGKDGANKLKIYVVQLRHDSSFDAIACVPKDQFERGFSWSSWLDIEAVQVRES